MIRDFKSITIVAVYLLANAAIIALSWTRPSAVDSITQAVRSMAPEFSQIEQLEYFHLKKGLPQMSLLAETMRSQGEEVAEFQQPKGVYNYHQKNKTLKYQAQEGIYRKVKNILVLDGAVKVVSSEAQYYADKVKYFFDKDLMIGTGNVKFEGDDLKTQDRVVVEAQQMRAQPKQQFSQFSGEVRGVLSRKRSYEGNMTFASHEMQLYGDKSMAHLEGDVRMKRQDYVITAGKADIYLENFNKSLKYFVMNDDVKMREKLQNPQGEVTERKAFAERLEGFGREQKMVLSGAPRVEQGSDVIKGYRITVRENVDLIEVDDAMSDVQFKRKEKKN